MTEEASKPARGPLVTPYRLVVSIALAAAFAGLWYAFTSSEDDPPATFTDSRVLLVRPAQDSNALRQERIFARVTDDYTGVLDVDGIEIPEDQLDRREGLSSIGYTPGPGTETGALEPGRRCATVIFWPISSTREAGADTYRWCWNVN